MSAFSTLKIRRTIPVTMAVLALGFAVACAKNDGGSTKVEVKGGGPVDKAAQTTSLTEQLTVAFEGYDSSNAKNLALSKRIEGATAVIHTSADDAKISEAQIQLLIGGKSDDQPAVQLFAAGLVKKSEKLAVLNPLVEGAKELYLENQEKTSSPEAEKIRVQASCLDEACSKLAVRIVDFSNAQSETDLGEQAMLVFERKDKESDDAEMIWSADIDSTKEDAMMKPNFEEALHARVEKGLKVSEPGKVEEKKPEDAKPADTKPADGEGTPEVIPEVTPEATPVPENTESEVVPAASDDASRAAGNKTEDAY